ncbi:hypothetical protein BURPS1710b_1098 [Burkholderia pseudomallei 1710b]|uniref:Uncharacterized protein n=1 Tax=Burkholderia pseudomallei (strain 1710b) TaxID=320372 RepID=Q3JV93_BURP1|nr:hypothetical protein BURPS1710b_1098 [Burkholderia pseudomallei 1710b]
MVDADVTRARPDQLAVGALLERVRDPAGDAPRGEQRERGARRQRERALERDEREIDRRLVVERGLRRFDERQRAVERGVRARAGDERVEEQRRARIPVRIQRMAEARQPRARVRLAFVRGDSRGDVALEIARRGCAVEERRDAQRLAAVARAGQRGEAARDRAEQRRARRRDAAHGEGRRIEFVIGAEHERHAQQLGIARVRQSPCGGELPMHGFGARRACRERGRRDAQQHGGFVELRVAASGVEFGGGSRRIGRIGWCAMPRRRGIGGRCRAAAIGPFRRERYRHRRSRAGEPRPHPVTGLYETRDTTMDSMRREFSATLAACALRARS